jgi:hypothetical protein
MVGSAIVHEDRDFDIERRPKIGVDNYTPLLTTASQARHAPRVALVQFAVYACQGMASVFLNSSATITE